MEQINAELKEFRDSLSKRELNAFYAGQCVGQLIADQQQKRGELMKENVRSARISLRFWMKERKERWPNE